MTIPWLKTNNSQGLFLKDRYSLYSIQILNPNNIGIINMRVKDCIIDNVQCVDIDKIPDLKKKGICSIQFYCNIKNIFSFQIFINSNAKIFTRICGIKSFSTKFNLNFTVYLLSLVFRRCLEGVLRSNGRKIIVENISNLNWVCDSTIICIYNFWNI